MKRTTKLLSVLCGCAALPLAALAQVSAATDPVGFVTITTLSNSDTIFATPLAQPEAFRGSVSTLSSSTITASGTPGFTPNAFVYVAGTQSNTYYLRFRTGAKAGAYYTVTANTANTLTIDLAGDLLTGASPGDQFAIIPYWTLGTVFPASAVGTAFQNSINAALITTQVFFPNINATGINVGLAGTYYFSGNHWRAFVSGETTLVFDDTVLPPDSYVTIRNKNFAGTITVMGGVVTTPQTSPVNAFATNKQDNFVALTYPVPVTFNQSGLFTSTVSTTNAVRSSANAALIVDEVFVYDNTVAGINKSPTTYYFSGGAWRKFVSGGSLVDSGNDIVFQPGSGVIIRRGVDSAGPRSVDWTFTP